MTQYYHDMVVKRLAIDTVLLVLGSNPIDIIVSPGQARVTDLKGVTEHVRTMKNSFEISK